MPHVLSTYIKIKTYSNNLPRRKRGRTPVAVFRYILIFIIWETFSTQLSNIRTRFCLNLYVHHKLQKWHNSSYSLMDIKPKIHTVTKVRKCFPSSCTVKLQNSLTKDPYPDTQAPYLRSVSIYCKFCQTRTRRHGWLLPWSWDYSKV
jgi:hypothetical protein